MGRYANRLRELNNDWQNAEVKENEFSPLPDGKYQVKVNSVHVEENEEWRSLWLVWEFVVLEGQYQNRKIFKRARLDDPDRLSWVKTDFHRLGIVFDNLSEIEENLQFALDAILEVQLKTTKPNTEGKTYQNCYINRRLDDQETEGTQDNYTFTDADVPF